MENCSHQIVLSPASRRNRVLSELHYSNIFESQLIDSPDNTIKGLSTNRAKALFAMRKADYSLFSNASWNTNAIAIGTCKASRPVSVFVKTSFLRSLYTSAVMR